MKTILVIDDDPEIRSLVDLSLGITADWRVIEASSGPESVGILQQMKPDAILLDIHMPGIDGLTTLSLIRQEPKNRDIPVLAYTADPTALDPNNLPEGLKGVLLKPFSPDALVERLKELMNPSGSD